jgi:hypothetical protein
VAESPVTEFGASLDAPVRATVDRLVEAILGAGVPLDAAIKRRRLTFAVDGDFHHWLCGIGTTRRGVVLQFHFGALLRDPDRRLTAGESRCLRRSAP